jgi:hypothetical protein
MSPGLRHFYELGPFRVDPGERTLFREGKPVPLPPKTFDMLLVLVENRGRVLSKSESDTPRRAGGLRELGRLKGGRAVGLDAARCAS